MAKSEAINPEGTITRVAASVVRMLTSPKSFITEVPTVAGLLVGRVQKQEYDALYRQYNAGLIKKAELIAYTEVGTRHQRKIAKKLIKGGSR